MPAQSPIGWAAEVLRFWFDELPREAWFKKDGAVDVRIRERFLSLHETIAQNLPEETEDDAKAALAAILLLDQFPRNMFRETPRAFATDPLALAIATSAVGQGLDERLTAAERLFLYLPFEHSEAASDQERSVALISKLGDDEWTRYAKAHKEIIDRFGRFPHRNAILGRASTNDEIKFLDQPGSSF